MKSVLAFLVVLGVNVAQADMANLCENEVVIQAVQKVMENIDAVKTPISGYSILAEQAVVTAAGAKDAAGLSIDTYTVMVNVTDASGAVVRNSVQMDVTSNGDGTCDYIKKTTVITVQ